MDTYLVSPFPDVCTISTHPGTVNCRFTHDHGAVNEYLVDVIELYLFSMQFLTQKRILIKTSRAYFLSFAF